MLEFSNILANSMTPQVGIIFISISLHTVLFVCRGTSGEGEGPLPPKSHTHARTHTHMHTHTHIHTHMHARMHTHTHAHTHSISVTHKAQICNPDSMTAAFQPHTFTFLVYNLTCAAVFQAGHLAVPTNIFMNKNLL